MIHSRRNLAFVAGLLTAGICGFAPTASAIDVPEEVLKAEEARIAAIKKATPATVAIFAQQGQGGGSGVLISADGYALSNFHVTQPAGAAMKCGLPDGKLYDAVIVGLDPTGDVALIKILGREDFPIAEMADSDEVRTGDWCFAAGNPFLLATDFQPTITWGVVSGVHRYQYPAGTLLEYADCLQADAAINPGNSGGPLFDATGRLIGINGRGSFEKRGRVNVGVGYAISINQIKNFLGQLKSGRIVDHATLGARVSTSEDGRVVVTDIIEDSDAFRRGLRYDDEIIHFAGRPIRTVNAFKNALGIYPKGWRVPLSYRRGGQRFDILVRLRGVHSKAELVALEKGEAEPPQERPKPGDKPKDDPNKPKPPRAKLPQQKTPEMPAVAKRHYEKKSGYANYHFNEQHQARLAKILTQGDFAALGGRWEFQGTDAGGAAVQLVMSDNEVSISLPVGDSKLTVSEDLSEDIAPAASGGLLAALQQWHKVLLVGPKKFGSVHYEGEAPVAGLGHLADVLVTTDSGVTCHWYVDPQAQRLVAVEMYLDDDVDPCEVYFRDYGEVQGRVVPQTFEVRYNDQVFGVFKWSKIELSKAEAP